MSQWREMRLGDAVSITHGWPFVGELCSEELTGKPIIVSIGNFRYTGGFRFGETMVREYRGDYPKEFELTPGETLLVMTCQTAGGEILGIPARVPNDDHTYLHNQRMGKVVVNRPDLVDEDFLYWLFLWPEFNRELFVSATGTKILHTAPTRIEAFRFCCPLLPEQRAIAAVLGALDDKIELNRRMNETLEALAQSLFKSWFVDATQSALPKGWRESKVSDLATLSRDGLNPGEFPDETFDHYSLPAFDEGRTPKPEKGDTIMSNKFIVPPDCVMVSKLNPRIPRIWLPDMRGPNRAVCSTEFLVATPKPGVSREFLYCLFINESFASVFTTMVTGTSGSHQRVRPESLLNMDTPLPPELLVQKFTNTVAPMLKRISQNIHESRTLAALRDALLPKLLSGELRVPAASGSMKASA